MSSPGKPPLSGTNVFLTGFMGSGKSVVGPSLARRLGLRFVDLDLELEKESRKSIVQLFAFLGEGGFRAKESEKLAGLCRLSRQVIALGGGAALKPENRELIARAGRSVYLRAKNETLVERLMPELSQRPLLAGISTPAELGARISKLRAEREAAYALATLTVDCDGVDPDEIAREIEAGLQS